MARYKKNLNRPIQISAGQKPDIVRIVFFILFFSIGGAAMGISVLCEDLVQYYSNAQLTEAAGQSIEKLNSLNEDYTTILEILEEDPNNYKRIASTATGVNYKDTNSVYPRATARQLAAARKALADPNEGMAEPTIPTWLSRCSEPRKRMILFCSGVALILVSSVCFRPIKNISQKE